MTARPHVLVVNAGSSSLKYRVLDGSGARTVAAGLVSEIGGASRHRHEQEGEVTERDVTCPGHAEAFALAGSALAAGGGFDPGDLVAVGHRVVHGGPRFTEPVLVDDGVLRALRDLGPLAPLHNPANVEGIVRAQAAFPGVPHVAVFDTAFHATLPAAAHTYAVPGDWRTAHDVRRYGFHGSSYAWVSRRTAQLLGRPVADVAMVVLHLGNGARRASQGCQASAASRGRLGNPPIAGAPVGSTARARPIVRWTWWRSTARNGGRKGTILDRYLVPIGCSARKARAANPASAVSQACTSRRWTSSAIAWCWN